MQNLKQIKEPLKNHNFKKVLSEIEKYLSNQNNPIDEELLKLQIECQIKLGKLDEALKSINLIQTIFPSVYQNNPFGLALKYAHCCQSKLIRQILETNTLSETEYYQLAKICYNNRLYDLALELFNYLTNAKDISIATSSNAHLKVLTSYQENNQGIFIPQTYNSFKYFGSTLLPGHVIKVKNVRNNYKENTNKHNNKTSYMIWKIESDFIYAFAITTNIDDKSYIIPKTNYQLKDNDRCLKPILYRLTKEEIITVVDKINDEDFAMAINTMYLNICTSDKGSWNMEIEYFMNSILLNQDITVGTIILLRNPAPHYYYIFAIDNYNQKYQTIEVDENFLPIDKKLTPIYIDINSKIFAAIAPNNISNITTKKQTLKQNKKK